MIESDDDTDNLIIVVSLYYSYSIIIVPTPLVITTSGSVTAQRTVNLTCTVELSHSVDVSVTVNSEWSGPDGFVTANTAQPVMGSSTTYTSTVMVRSFGRDQSGNYTCRANVSSTSPYIMSSMDMSTTSVAAGIKFVFTYETHNYAFLY